MHKTSCDMYTNVIGEIINKKYLQCTRGFRKS
jgi:hypothetical protein